MAKKRDPYQQQAEAQALLRFGPETSILAALLRDAEERRDTSLRQATGTRQRSVAAVDAAMPQLQQAYQGAGQQAAPLFATPGGGVESSALQARLAESQAQAAQQLEARRVSAIEGEGAARSQTLRDYASDRGKVLARAQDLAQEKGAFTTSALQEMIGADQKAAADAAELQARLNQDERESIRSSGFDPDSGLPLPGGKADPRSRKRTAGAGTASPEAQRTAGTEFQRAVNAAAGGVRGRAKTPELRQQLVGRLIEGTEGSGGQTVYEDVPELDAAGRPTGKTKRQEKLNRDGTPVTTAKRPGFKPVERTVADAAVEQAMFGYVTTATVRKLQKLGYSVNRIPGLTTEFAYRRSRPRPSRTTQRPRNAPGAGGQLRPT